MIKLIRDKLAASHFWGFDKILKRIKLDYTKPEGEEDAVTIFDNDGNGIDGVMLSAKSLEVTADVEYGPNSGETVNKDDSVRLAIQKIGSRLKSQIEQGTPGPDGPQGEDGLSAYEVAVENGFVGTEQDWLDSLVGEDGAQGPQGEQGIPGVDADAKTIPSWLMANIAGGSTTYPSPGEFVYVTFNELKFRVSVHDVNNSNHYATGDQSGLINNVKKGDIICLYGTLNNKMIYRYVTKDPILVDGGASGFYFEIEVNDANAGSGSSQIVLNEVYQMYSPIKLNERTTEGLDQLLAGTMLDTQTIEFAEELPGQWYAYMKKEGGGDLRCNIAGSIYVLDCTTGDGPLGEARCGPITLGTAADIFKSFLLVRLVGGVATFESHDNYPSGFPYIEAAQVAFLDEVLSSAFGQPVGYQRFNDSLMHGDDQRGQIAHIGENSRGDGLKIYDGGEVQVNITTNAGLDNVLLSRSAMLFSQMHTGILDAEGSINNYVIVNHVSGDAVFINDLNEITEDANGDPLHTNGNWYGIEVAVTISSEGYGSLTLVWLPTGSYSTQEEAIADPLSYSGVSISLELRFAITRLCRVVLGYTNAGQTITNPLGTTETQDRRNYDFGYSGGGGGLSGSNDFTKYPYVPQNTPPSPLAEGTTYFDNIKKNLVVQSGGETNLDVGRENWVRVQNTTGATVEAGKWISLTSRDQATGLFNFVLAQSNNKATSLNVCCLTETLLHTEVGEATTYGDVNDIDTSSFNSGDQQYLSSAVAGDSVIIEPAYPNFSVKLAKVGIVDGSVGNIFVNPDSDPQYATGSSSIFPPAIVLSYITSNQGQPLELYKAYSANTLPTIKRTLGAGDWGGSQLDPVLSNGGKIRRISIQCAQASVSAISKAGTLYHRMLIYRIRTQTAGGPQLLHTVDVPVTNPNAVKTQNQLSDGFAVKAALDIDLSISDNDAIGFLIDNGSGIGSGDTHINAWKDAVISVSMY